MGHLGQFIIKTNGKYKKLSELTGLTFEDGKQYTFQIQNSAFVLSSATVPKDGGFYIAAPTLNLFTKTAGEDFYIKTTCIEAMINLAQ